MIDSIDHLGGSHSGGTYMVLSRTKIVTTIVGLTAVVSSVGLGQPAFGDTSSPTITTVTITSDPGGTITTDGGGSMAAKQAVLKADAAAATPVAVPDYTVSNKELYSSGSTNMYGSYSSISGKTDADVTSGWEEYADFKDSSATVDWWGGSPVNAKQLQASMKWEVHGLDVSVSVPAGASFSRSGSSVTWEPPSVANVWHESLSRSSSVHFATPFTFTSDYFWSDANVLLGSTWYYVAGN